MSQKFYNISCACFQCVYHITKAVQAVAGTVLVDTIMLRHCILLHSLWDSYIAQMNMQCSLIWKLVLYESELNHDVVQKIKT